jgi:hypothetical protein
MEATTRSRSGESIRGLIAGLREDVKTLFREEIRLIKTELSEKFSHFSRNAVSLAIGGVAAFLGLIWLLLSISFIIGYGFEALGLGTGVALFLGFLVPALVLGVVGGILIAKALSGFSSESIVPEKTVETLREIKNGGLEQVPITTYSVETKPEDKRSSEQIRADVERTRSRIGREVRGIRTRLNVAHVAGNVANRVVNNPVRSFSIGLGTGLMGFVILRIARLLGRRHAA